MESRAFDVSLKFSYVTQVISKLPSVQELSSYCSTQPKGEIPSVWAGGLDPFSTCVYAVGLVLTLQS